MSTHLHNRNRIPYGGGYTLNDPNRAMVGSGTRFDDLLRSIRIWRNANSIPIGLGFEAEVEQAVCEKYPDECDGGSTHKPRRTKLSLATVLRGTRVLLEFKLAGSPYVEQSEAERRAAICAACPWNVDYAKPCGGNCGGLKEVVASIVGGKATPFDDRLKSCGICGCVAKAHIWLPLAFLRKGVTDSQREEFAAVQNCWKKDA